MLGKSTEPPPLFGFSMFGFFFFLAAPCGMGESPLSRDQTCVPCTRSMASSPPDCQGSPLPPRAVAAHFSHHRIQVASFPYNLKFKVVGVTQWRACSWLSKAPEGNGHRGAWTVWPDRQSPAPHLPGPTRLSLSHLTWGTDSDRIRLPQAS